MIEWIFFIELFYSYLLIALKVAFVVATKATLGKKDSAIAWDTCHSCPSAWIQGPVPLSVQFPATHLEYLGEWILFQSFGGQDHQIEGVSLRNKNK